MVVRSGAGRLSDDNKGAMPTDAARRSIRERLEARRSSLLSRYQGTLAPGGPVPADEPDEDDEHGERAAAAPWEARVLSAITEVDLRTLDNVARALHRLDSDTYGICTGCNEVIEPARLRALPEATECVDCVRGATAASARWAVSTAEGAEQGAAQ